MKFHATFLVSTMLLFSFCQAQDLHNNRAHADAKLDASQAKNIPVAWQLERRGPVTHRPLEHDGDVISADWTGHVFCINPQDGTYVWDKPIADKVMTKMPWYGFVGTGAIAEGTLVEASAAGIAYGIDPKTGETKWETKLSDQKHAGSISNLLAHEGVVFIGLSSPEEALDGMTKDFKPTFQGEVLAIRSRDGEIVWRTSLAEKPHTGAGMWSSFVIDEETGTLFFTTSNNYVGEASDTSDGFFAVDARTGEKKWHRQMTGNDVWTKGEPVGPDYAFGAGPQLFEAGGRKLVGAGQKSGYFHVLDRENGEWVWSTFVGYPEIGGGIRGEAAIADDRIIVWSNNSYVDGKPPENFPITIKALDAKTGETLWMRDKAQPAVGKSSGLLVGDVYFIGSLDGVMHGYAAADGKDVWKSENYGSVGSSPTLVGNNLLVWGTGVPKMFSGGGGKNGIVAVKLPVSDTTQSSASEVSDLQLYAGGQEPTDSAKAFDRKVDPSAINVPPGFKVEVFARGLNFPTDITFTEDGQAYISEAGGHFYGTDPTKAPPPRILKVMPDGSTQVVLDNNVPYTAIQKAKTYQEIPSGLIAPIEAVTANPDNGLLYIAHRSRYSTFNPETKEFKTIIDNLPAWGIFHNTKAQFDSDGKMVFGISAQGNSGPVDFAIMKVASFFNIPGVREIPCVDVILTGEDYWVDNGFTKEKGDQKLTGVFVPYGEQTEPGQLVKGEFWGNSGLYRAEPDGSEPELLAWGIRNAFHQEFGPDGRLYFSNNSGNPIPGRPIYDDWETIYVLEEGAWYGWPDYYSGVPVTDKRFRKPEDPQFKDKKMPMNVISHKFALTEKTRQRLLKGAQTPPQPLVKITPHAAAQGFVFAPKEWGFDEQEVLLAEYGAVIPYEVVKEELAGFQVSRVDLKTGKRVPFMSNKSGKPASAALGQPAPQGQGLERPLRLEVGPDGAVYVVDFGVFDVSPKPKGKPTKMAFANSGVIWKITRTQ